LNVTNIRLDIINIFMLEICHKFWEELTFVTLVQIHQSI